MRKALLLFLLGFSLICYAQKAETAAQILEKCAAKFENSKGIEATFIMKELNQSNQIVNEMQGNLKNRKEKFFVSTSLFTTWFDGKTQWSYLVDNSEVNMTHPTTEEIEQSNPVSLLRLYKKGFKANLISTVVRNNLSIAEIELLPIDRRSPWRRVLLCINKKSYLPSLIVLESSKGDKTEIHFNAINEHANYPDSDFVFRLNNYPDVELIDLR